MWRFILITFAFLFFGLYELSGGADYQPKDGSLQRPIAAAEPATAPRPAHKPVPANSQVVLAKAGTDSLRAPEVRVRISDASKRARLTQGAQAKPEVAGVSTVAANPDKIARLIAAARVSHQADPAPKVTVQPAYADVNGAVDGDIREVKPARVNLRQGPGTIYEIEAKLVQGTKVEVLDDDGMGWVELRVLDTGETGWMAEYLLVSVN
ncbi:SH3 domain-containing protein [Aquicoccus sp. G2-2]|uniref:SH3 domain-containing protein n=1 Tax=Aquicoccus sp. G2-2 TaxID=3092120 RepID=UPI002AE05AEB|nr:SH3 domain-containing protein [Aquicoccus sp. G2-2]MEA1112356.1 SH3 domain-containing protein [Aquicoccus sp. G2-2]